ncbi:hypothetical protein K488DRAFT_84868 [Vararia minispora EC-137]|uniref:Uncharacterized protein n=1 Tax=Vararia minispora EC-137 TaxID=1314806 RepID=A0ACB8QP09_9AGAM|nr:hypothetical protein K488DRAFT_84868 [Vararia minispora EC-137]
MAELQDAVWSVAEAADETMKDERPETLPEFTEDDLLAFYEDVLSIPGQETLLSPKQHEPGTQTQQGVASVDELAKALEHQQLAAQQSRSEPSPLLATLQARLPQSKKSAQNLSPAEGMPDLNLLPTYKQVVHRLKQIVPEVVKTRSKNATVPVVIMTQSDWNLLVHTCVYHKDLDSAESVLDLMRLSGDVDIAELLADVMAVYANKGDVLNTERVLRRHLTDNPTDRQRDLHVKACLRSADPKTIPTSALQVLHRYESQNLPAPQKTYNRLIDRLFAIHSSTGTAQAWDLFAHMRYVAHPQPDARMYATMIRACGSAAEPERALDLFTEMTVDRRMLPTQAAYNAVIYACARAGSRSYVSQAFRLAREMLDTHRDARGIPAFVADGAIFAALLEGAKRIGDLQRARWILVELVAEVQKGQADLSVTEEMMMHVFHAYSAYKPPFRRSMALEVQGDGPAYQENPKPSAPVPSSPSSNTSSPPVKSAQTGSPAFTALPPQSRAEVIHEARILFSRILTDRAAGPSRPLHTVTLTPRLLSAYIGVHFSHAKLEDAAKLFDTLFDEHGVKCTPRILIEALERCAIAQKNERVCAMEFAERVWMRWEEMEMGGTVSLSPRLIERAHAAMIRVHALLRDVPRAMDALHVFVARYPPQIVRDSSGFPILLSRRTRLKGERPLVRLMSATELKDDTVPPFLGWTDLEILHHRCVAAGRHDAIKYIKWVCYAYRGSLKMRREKFLGIQEERWQARLREKREAIPVV